MIKTPQSTFDFGQLHASLYLGFCCFIHEQARDLKLDTIYFCTREGEFFKVVFDALFNRTGAGKEGISSELLEVSRLSTFGPSLSRLDTDSLMRIWNQYTEQSPFSFLTTLNLSPKDFEEHFDQAGLPMDKAVSKPWANEAFKAVLGNELFLEKAHQHLEKHRKPALNYLESKFADRERIGMVDIGWRGSIQDNLAMTFKQRIFHGFYLGISRYFNKQPENTQKFAFGPNRNLSPKDFDLLHAVDVMEMISNSPNGSALYYQAMIDGTVKPLRKKREVEDQVYQSFTRDFQQGVLAAARAAELDVLLDSYRSGDLRNAALDTWRELLKQPSDLMVKAYFKLKHNEEFGLGMFYDKAYTPSLINLLTYPFYSSGRKRLESYVKYSQWAKGVWLRKDISLGKKLPLYAAIRAGLIAKWFKNRRAVSN